MPKTNAIKNFSKNIYSLKENLNGIKRFSELLINHHKNELNWEALLKVKEIIDKSDDFESILDEIINLTNKI